LGYLKIPQFPHPIAEGGLTIVKSKNLDLTKYRFLKGILCIKFGRKKWLGRLTLEEEREQGTIITIPGSTTLCPIISSSQFFAHKTTF